MVSFKHLLQKQDFDAVVAHLALDYNVKSRTELPISRIMRLLEMLDAYFSIFVL